MATSGARRRPQKYPIELRERAVRMVFEVREEPGGDTPGVIGRIAKQLGIGTESSRIWVKQAEIDEGHKPGTSTADAQRIFELERENRELRRANDMAGSTGERTGLVRIRAHRSLERHHARSTESRTEAVGVPSSSSRVAAGGHRSRGRLHRCDGWADGARRSIHDRFAR